MVKRTVRCVYLKNCYLAEALECYGFKTDCPLYQHSNQEPCNELRFHAAMDELISRTRQKHDRVNQARNKKQPAARES